MVLRATGALAGFRVGQLVDDFVDVVGFALDRAGDRPAAEAAEAVPFSVAARAREIHLRNRDAFALDVEPDVALGPVEQRLHADMLAGRAARRELIPKFRRLVLVVPLEVLVARWKIALLRAR